MANSGLDFMSDRIEQALKLGFVKISRNLRGSHGAANNKGRRTKKNKLSTEAVEHIRKLDAEFHTVNQIVEKTGRMKKDVLDVLNNSGVYSK